MPLKSKAQQRYMFAAESRGELPKGTALRWAHETQAAGQDLKKLPNKVKKKKAKKAKKGMRKVASIIWETFKKEATVGTTTASAPATTMAGKRHARMTPGKLDVPNRLVSGTAQGFNPADSIKKK